MAEINAANSVDTNTLEVGLFANLLFLFNNFRNIGSKRFIPATKLAANIGNFRGCKAFIMVFFTLGMILSYLFFLMALKIWPMAFGKTK